MPPSRERHVLDNTLVVYAVISRQINYTDTPLYICCVRHQTARWCSGTTIYHNDIRINWMETRRPTICGWCNPSMSAWINLITGQRGLRTVKSCYNDLRMTGFLHISENMFMLELLVVLFASLSQTFVLLLPDRNPLVYL